MTDVEIETKLAELDRLLNDPETRMDPHKVWSLLAEISGAQAGGRGQSPASPAMPKGAATA